MSEHGPEPAYPGRPDLEPVAPPVAEIEAEIKAEIAAEMEAERAQARPSPTGNGAAGVGTDGADGGWPEPPPPVPDPAAEVLAWLRGEFDDVNANLQSLSNRLGRQEETVLRITESQATELNSTLAELEGCTAHLRNEAATLRDTRAQLAQALPELVAGAVQSAVAGAVTELRGAVAQLGAALSEALPAAVADALAPTLSADRSAGAPAPADDEGDGPDIVSQLHEAQDEAAEWFTIVVDEAVRRAVERWLAPAVPATPAPVPAPPVLDAPPVAPMGSSDSSAAVATAEPTLPAATVAPAAEALGAEVGAPVETPPLPGMAAAPMAFVAADPVAPSPTTDLPAPGPPAGAPAAEGVVPDAGEPAAPGGRESPVTCVLPGVAVGPTLAMGVSTALGRARLRRRRRRPAGAPAAGLFRHDPFAGELSRRLERFALARRGLAWGSGSGAGPADGSGGAPGGPITGATVVAAERDGEEIALDLAPRPVALVGPDAQDAGRALVATFLTTRDPSASVIVAGDLLPAGPTFPGLERSADLATALDSVEAEITRRTAAPPAGGGYDPAHPALLLVCSEPLGALSSRVGELVGRGRQVGVSALVVGEATEGATVISLDPGGAVRDVSPPSGEADLAGSRMFTVGSKAMTEVLEVMVAARTDDEVTPIAEVHSEPFPLLSGPTPAPIQVRVLGPYRIDVAGAEVRSGLRAKARELLAFYLLHPEGTTLDVATEALWPEADPGRGSEWFWTALGNLRSRLRGVTGIKSLKIIERDGDRYRIEPVFDVDLWRFQAALPPPGASTGDPEWAAALQDAADMYDGELLAGVDWAWADVPREDLRRRAVDVLVSLGATRLVAGDVRGALDVLSHAIEVDPLAEQLYRRIMRLHARQFRPDEVEATFARLKARLGELGLEPTIESTLLVEELAGSRS
jgi:DNA-binding SARP family transcriptional activator